MTNFGFILFRDLVHLKIVAFICIVSFIFLFHILRIYAEKINKYIILVDEFK